MSDRVAQTGRVIRGGIIGCGMIAEYHLRAWARIPEVAIVALCDTDRARAEQRRAERAPEAGVYADAAELLRREALDFVDILTPPSLHREHVMAAHDAGVHVICQKPLCDRIEDARALVAAFDGHPRLFCVHENHPYRPWFRRVAALHAEGLFGTPRLLRLQQHDRREPPERFKAEAPHGVWFEYGVHLVAMMRALLGEPERVSARFAHINPRVHGESLALVVFDYPGATAVIDIAWKAHGVNEGGALLLGDSGAALYEGRMTRGESARFRIDRGDEVVHDEACSPTVEFTESFYLLQRAFTDALLGRGEPPEPAADNLRTLELTFAGYAAAARGEAVTVAPI